jgi:hypothetical protein
LTTVAALLSRAKDSIESGVTSWRAATEDMAAAKAQGASQRQIAEAVGMSSAWVHQMLKWRAEGYKDATPFGPQSKANRQRARAGQATDQKKQKADQSDTDRDQADAAAARARAEAAKAEAAKARAQAVRAIDEAMRAKAEAVRERIRAEKAYADTRVAGANLGALARPIDIGIRKCLVKTLGMLGSERDEERASAALIADKERARLGLTWDELIVPVQTEDSDDLDFDDEDLEDDDLDDDLDDEDLDDAGPDGEQTA